MTRAVRHNLVPVSLIARYFGHGKGVPFWRKTQQRNGKPEPGVCTEWRYGKPTWNKVVPSKYQSSAKMVVATKINIPHCCSAIILDHVKHRVPKVNKLSSLEVDR